MPVMKPSFVIDAPIDKVWAYMSNMENVGSCVPGCEVNVIDNTTSEWAMTVKMGPLKKTIEMTNHVIEQDDANYHVHFKCDGDMVDCIGVGDMTPQDGGTFVDFSLTLEAKGPGAQMVDRLITGKLPEYQEYFVEHVTEALS